MKHLDLFSGIGGFALAARWAGVKTVGFVEYDDFCQRVLKKNFPGVPIHGDIKTFKGERGSADLITGGFPCQPFSVAGKRRGSEDDRALWPEMFRVIQEVRPTWVLGENVAGIIGVELDQVLSDLEGAGYEVQPFIIPACAVDAPHRRDRVWIVGHAKCGGCGGESWRRTGEESPDGHSQLEKRSMAHAAEGGLRRGSAPGETGQSAQRGQDVANAEGERRGEAREHCGGPEERAAGGGIISDSVPSRSQNWNAGEDKKRTCGKSAGENSGPNRGIWSAKSGVGRVDDGISGRMDGPWPADPHPEIPRTAIKVKGRANRLKALGNAIVPQVAYQIIRAMTEAS